MDDRNSGSGRFITFHNQKDGRFTTGTCVHKYRDCSQLKSRIGIIEIFGEMVKLMPKCGFCYNRQEKNKERNVR